MSGIMRCTNDDCSEKKDCYRFNASKAENTSETNYKSICKKENDYRYFWGTKKSLDDVEDEMFPTYG